MGTRLLASLATCPVVRMGDYEYFVHPLADGIPAVEPALLREVVDEVVAIADRRVNRIVTVEAMGIPLATAVSLRLGIPFTVVRKRSYGLPGEREVGQSTGYSTNRLFVNGLGRGDRVLVVDDVVSTGGTLAALLQGLRGIEVDVRDVVVVFEKGAGRAVVEKEFGRPIKCLQQIEVRDGRVIPVPANPAPAARSSRGPPGRRSRAGDRRSR
ncbi:MAG: hypoxanthine/guanine phosphoribosyltransferase [Thermoplasmatota archaeon]